MTSRTPRILLVAALLAACDRTGVTPKPAGAKTPTVAASTKSKPSAGAASPAVLATAAGPDVLLPPQGEATTLHGKVALDIAYAVEAGGAKFISDQGGGLIANNSAGLKVGEPGSNLINREHAGIITHNGAGLVGKVKLLSDNGGSIISSNGSSLIANNAGNVISDQGGGLIANNSAGIIGKTKYGFGLLATGDRVHASVPTAGMLVAVLSLAEGAYLPLGVDRSGQPIYAVYADSQGAFTVHLPAGVKENVLVVSAVPGTTDTRLAIDRLIDPQAEGNIGVDDGTTVITTYLRRAVVARFQEVVSPDACRPAGTHDSLSEATFRVAVTFFQEDFDGAAFKGLGTASRERVLTRFTDLLLAQLDFEAVTMISAVSPDSKLSGPAFPIMRDILARIERAAAVRLEADRGYFDKAPYVQLANLGRGNLTPWTIRKPADLTEFMVTEYLTTNDTAIIHRMETMLVDLGLPATMRADLVGAGGSIFASVVPLLTEATSRDRLQAVLREVIAEEGALPPIADQPCPAPPKLPEFQTTVSTIAGGEDSGDVNGPGVTARFNKPVRLVVDPTGFLYVSDVGNHDIRRIALNDPAFPVTRVAGDGKDYVDGAGAAGPARFNAPCGLWLDGKGGLIVADRGNHRLRRITGYDGATPAVTTLAGDGGAGFLDGPALTARMNEPEDVVGGPDGALFIADVRNQRIRRLGADGVLSTFAGSGSAFLLNGGPGEVTFNQPRGLAFGLAGALLVVETKSALVRYLTAAGAGTVYAGQGRDGADDGTFYTANFNSPRAIAVDGTGVAYVADMENQRIRRLDPKGLVSTLAGGGEAKSTAGAFADGPGANARFNLPEGVAVGPDGTVYVADSGNHRIRMIKIAK